MSSKSCSRRFHGFDVVYKLSESGSSRYFRATLELTVDEDGFQVTRGEVVPSQPVRARWIMGGREPVDVIWTGDVAPVLISDRLQGILRERGFSGWSTYAVELHGKSGEVIPGYSGLVVHGRCGPIDETKSVEVPRDRPSKLKLLKGLYFDPATWDGSDFYMPEGKSCWVFVTEEVKESFEKAKIKNVELTALSRAERLTL